ncbi:MAG TPA: 6-carboxytetrahydropterin synthase QueD [Kofleriaceae bacterium]|nr:6-carboxytetrahydropterin synthase QueD [Kofleriaceae bacterium]
MICRLSRDYRFEAAHFLPRVPAGHQCRRMHGHSYALRISIEGEPDPERGWVMDFAAMDEAVDPVVRRLDHQVLNEVPGLDNPTAELLAGWLWRELEGKLPVVEIEVAETDSARCVLRRG